ncbi:MAG: hypothetical protein OEY07_21090, partial [Gammaproteobacteria bacterium]|nr:hypothetical protein [Gammaproteobacteria bacterium]
MKRNYLQLIILFGLLFGTVGVRADVPEYIIQATNATSLNKNSIELDMPEIAENGSVVPVGIKKLVTG